MRRLGVLLALLSVSAPMRLSAQDPAWTNAMDLIAVGRTDSARQLLRRIVVEQPNSPWADDALLQLATMAFTAGNPAAVLEYAARLRFDYPGSELRPRAALWAGRAALEAGEPRAGCASLDTALAEATGNVELVNQVAFYRSRCGALLAAAPPEPAAGFEVQVAATRNRAEAGRLAGEFQRGGYRVRLQAGNDGLTRVRLGPYATREAADAALRAVRDSTGGSPFVVRVP